MPTSDNDPTELADTLTSGRSRREHLHEGALVGRYRIESALGEGGMGVVYRAHDPELGRDVAVKVIAPRGSEDDARARLLREAQAMAKLRHPNVVPIFDVGTIGDSVFVVMPLVDGGTLGGWLRGGRRAWRDVLDRFVLAGRGLAAAHRAGLVHRDFKPDNVLLGGGGEVLVADFGLARETDTRIDDATGSPSSPVTGVAGTLAYMAPEQLRGAVVDARADQFSFCISLWEGLHGARPQDAETRDAGLRAVLQRRADGDRNIPGWLRAAVSRGFAHDPEQRWPSMATLLEHLERRRKRPRRVATAIAALAAALSTTAAIAIARRGEGGVSCPRSAVALDTVWSADRRAAVESSFAAALPAGGDAARQTIASLDDYGGRWRAERIDACRATHERGEQSDQLLDRRNACLDRGIGELRALVAILGAADGEVVARAADAVRALPSPEACSAANVADRLPVPNDRRATDVNRTLAEIRASINAGQPGEARAKADAALGAAETIGHAGLLAEARLLHARVIADQEPERARDELDRALADAVRAGDHILEATIVIDTLQQAVQHAETAKMESLLPVMRAALARAGGDRNLVVEAATTEADALQHLGKVDEALASCARVIEADPSRGYDAAMCGCSVNGNAWRLEEADHPCADALAIAEKDFGREHPKTALAIRGVAAQENQLGHYESSLSLRERAIAIDEKAYGTESEIVANQLQGVALVLMNLGRPKEAKERLDRAAAIYRKIQDKPTRGTIDLHDHTARALMMLGDVEGSLREGDEALRTAEQLLGPDHPELAMKLYGHGNAYLMGGKLDIAMASFLRGIDIAERKVGSSSVLLGALLGGQCQVLIGLKRAKEAVAPCERSVRILDASGTDPDFAATSRGILGRALRDAGDKKRARTEMMIAREAFVKIGDKERLGWIDAMLATLSK
jgi:eukaryotic-like serine/threonine-protein kinase